MQYRRLGRSGLQLSVFGFGAWVTFGSQLNQAAARELLAQAYAAGVNFFDNAESYAHGEAERLMGRAIRELGWPRDRFCVSSKVFFGSVAEPGPNQKGLSRKHVVEACHAALDRLQVDYLDLYFCHRPDPQVSVSEIVWTMHQLVMAGKVLYWGTSEWTALEIQEAADFATRNHLIGPSMEQPQYNLLVRDRVEREYAPLYRSIGLGTTVFSPLASGLLSGKYRADGSGDGRLSNPKLAWLRPLVMGEDPRSRLAVVQRVEAVAKLANLPLSQLALAWCLRNPQVSSVILGASNPAQLKQNLDTLEATKALDAAYWMRLEHTLLGL